VRLHNNDDNDDNDNNDDNVENQILRVSGTLKVLDSPADDLWHAVIERLARELPAAVIDSQLRPARLVSLNGDRCLIAAPTPQSRDWLASRLTLVLARALSQLTGRDIRVEIEVVGE
jgi:hypothetical protein